MSCRKIPLCEAVKVMRPVAITVADAGEIMMLAPDWIVMLACTCLLGSASGVTMMITLSGCGGVAGAV